MNFASLTEEYAGANLKDARLSKRQVLLAVSVGASPRASFPTALSESELEGAYRFFSNKKVTPDAVLEPHFQQTLRRIADADVVLAVHDTTTLSFRNDGQREGFGSLSGASQQLWTHATLAVSADGTRCPLGLLAVTTDASIRYERWMEQVDEANLRVESKSKLVHIQDREADDYGFYAQFLSSGSRFVVRMQHDRQVHEGGVTKTVTEALSRAAVTVEREVILSVRGKNMGSKAKKVHPARNRRPARLSISAAPITLRKPVGRSDVPKTINVHAVHVWEASPPEGEPAVKWLLVTSEPIDSVDDMLRIVDWYRARWTVEEFFKALKSGCSIEKRQLESFPAFSNAVAFFCPMAWQLLLLRHRAQNDPEQNGETALPEGMITVLRHIARKPISPKPTAREVLFAVAALGGHLKRNGDPGWQTLGRGYDKLREALEIWNLALRTARSDQS